MMVPGVPEALRSRETFAVTVGQKPARACSTTARAWSNAAAAAFTF
jgi:hypothetical protein